MRRFDARRFFAILALLFAAAAIVAQGMLPKSETVMLVAYLASAFFWFVSSIWHYLLSDEWRVSGAALNAAAALSAGVGTVASVDGVWHRLGLL